MRVERRPQVADHAFLDADQASIAQLLPPLPGQEVIRTSITGRGGLIKCRDLEEAAAIGNIIWYSESGVKPNTVVRFDPKTEKFQTWVIPSGGGVVRNMMATPQGNLWLACSGVNGIAFVEVKGKAASKQKSSAAH